jgi:type IV secretion system protein VirB10
LTSPGFSQSATGDLAQELDQVGAQLMQKNLSVAPTLIIRPGYAFNVLVNKTMVLPAFGR